MGKRTEAGKVKRLLGDRANAKKLRAQVEKGNKRAEMKLHALRDRQKEASRKYRAKRKKQQEKDSMHI